MSKEFKLVTLTNPLPEAFEFRLDKQPYRVPAFKTVSMPMFLAVHGAKHLANKILIHKGKFADIFDGDKRTGGLAIDMGTRDYIAKQLLDIKKSELDLDEIIEDSKNAPKKKDLESGKPIAAITETPVGTITVKGAEKAGEEKVKKVEPKEKKPKGKSKGKKEQTPKARYKELKNRWPKVNAEERAEYRQLKIDLKINK